MANQTVVMTDSLYEYMLQVSLREPSLLAELRVVTAQLPAANMQIAPEQGQFLAFLIQLTGTQKILELGTFTGYSSLVMAMSLPERGHIITCDVNVEWTNIAQHFWQLAGVKHKIDLRLAPALDTLEALLLQGQENSFDLIFIDADKANYLHYYEKALLLVKPGGLIVIDNVLWGGDVCRPEVKNKSTEIIRQLNQKIHLDSRVAISLVPMTDGIFLVRKLI